MKRSIKLLSLILALIMSASILTGCFGRRKGEPPVSTSDKRVVMTLGGYNVTYDFYRYLFLNTKDYLSDGDKDFWTKEGNDVEMVKKYIIDSLNDTYAMFTLADKYKITLSDEDKTYIDNMIEQSKGTMTDEEFKKSLEASYMTPELYRFILEVQQLEILVYNHIIAEDSGIIFADDKTVKKAVSEDFVRATHILFLIEDEEGKTEKKELADQLLQRLKNGEDFEALKEEYSEDTGLKGNTDGYYFLRGVYDKAFEDAAFNLKEGEISEVVTSDLGYHIIKRLPIEDKYVDDNLEDLRSQYLTSKYYEIIEETYKDFEASYKKDYSDIKLDSFN